MYKEPKKHFSFEKHLYIKAFLIALAVSAAFFLPFVIYDRGIFLFYGDYNVQQIPFYQLAHRAIREGNIGFNLYTDLGVNFVGSYSFYLLGSPFFWLTIPFPNVALPYLMAPLFCLKFAVAATTACAFIRRFVTNQNYAVIGGLLYAFSGFGIYNIFFNHFHEVIAFFPLILLSIELYIEEGRKGLFAISVFLCSLCNYFFFFGEVVFTVIYFFVRVSTSKERWKITIPSFLGLALEAVIGLCLSGVLLVPSLITVLGNPRVNMFLNGWSGLVYGDSQRYLAILQCLFFPPDIPARPNFFPDANAKWSSLGAWLPLFGMCGVITFVQTHKKNFIRRILGISFVMALVPILNSAFSAFNDAYYARWFFMPILFMALATVISLERCTVKEFNTGIRWSLGITAAFCLVGVFPKKSNDEWTFGLTPYPERFWAYVIIALVCILLTVLAVNVWRRKKYFTRLMTGLVCVVTIIYAMVFIGTGKMHSYNEDFIIDQAIYGSQNISLEKEDDEFFRIDVYDGMDNLPMFWRLPSIQAFHSVVPSSVMSFYPEIGVERAVASRPEADQYALRTLTSCKYLFIESSREEREVCYGFELIDAQNGFDVYKNEYYVPIGFTYDTYCDKEYYDGTTESYRARLMLQAIVLSDEQIDKYTSNMVEIDEMTSFLSKTNMQEDTDKLRANCADSFTETSTGFKSSITLDKSNLVFYSIPYDEGWRAYVNGKEVEVECVNRGFVAVWAEEGANEIEFVYETPGLFAGIIVSLAALFMFIIYLISCSIYRKKHPRVKESDEQMFDELAELINNKSDVLSFQIHSAQELESKSTDGPLSFRLPPENAEAQSADNTQQDPEDEQ
ncbi:MAG: hypothetical protein E7539_03385 [Ruminococcaceae bacterium]|nr:hypothetical protein [Oscillospiraceae bacterium]